MGRRSRRAPALAVTGVSLLPCERGHAAGGQSFNGEAAILVKRVLLHVLKKLFAVAHGGGIEAENALDEGVGLGGKTLGGDDLRDEADLQRALRFDGIAKEDERESEARQGVPGA